MKPLQIARDITLSNYSTMRLGGTAAYVVSVTTRSEVSQAYQWAQSQGLPCLMVGSGSNIVWRDEGFAGLIILNRIMGYEAFQEDDTNVYLTIGSGENWDQAVARSVADGLTGIECLSYVPGTAGATPVQNVGAYGQEIAQSLSSLEAFDTQTGQFVNLMASDCGFSYRDSRFKSADRGRFMITAITLHLTKGNPAPPFYPALTKYLEDHQITSFTPQVIRDAVIAIRSSKLPDPNLVANNGSFFANPIIDELQFIQISAQYENMPNWPVPAGPQDTPGAKRVKLSAAWLLDQAGFKDAHDAETGMATWPAQPLVLVNEHAGSTADLLKFRQKIIDSVQEKFGVSLQQEPELLPDDPPQTAPV